MSDYTNEKTSERPVRLTLYMSSGQKITLDKVTYWLVGYDNDSDRVCQFKVTQDSNARNKLIYASIVLDRIEAIVET